MKLSQNGFDMIANFELSAGAARAWGLGEFDAQGNMIGIYPHYVFRKVDGVYKSDGGITLGYGYYVGPKKYEQDAEATKLIDQYATNASFTPPYVPNNGVSYRVPGSTYMPIEEAKALYAVTAPTYEAGVRKFLEDNSIVLKSNQFDALVSFTYNYGIYWWDEDKVMPNFIRNGNGVYDPDEVRRIFAMHDNPDRRAIEAEVFINGY